MGTDVAVVACGAGGSGMQVCVIFESVCVRRGGYICVYVSFSSRLDLCLSVFVCQLASANTLAAWQSACV